MSTAKQMPRITIDARMARISGIGTYLQNLVPRVVEQWAGCRFSVIARRADFPLFEGLERAELLACDANIYSLAEQLDLPRIIPDSTDLLWCPHYNIPLRYRGRLAVTVHDLNPIATLAPQTARAMYARFFLHVIRRRAAVILTDSAYSATDFCRRIGPPRALHAILLGVDARWFSLSPSRSGGRPYFLVVGNVKPHKNLRRLLQAFAQVCDEIPHDLVLVGASSTLRTSDDRALSIARALGSRVVLAGQVTDDALERYVADCAALVLPSLYEGFGLPALEALAAGRPVAVSRCTSLPEVCGEEASYFDPLSVSGMADVLRELADQPKDSDEDRERRRAWARRFDWNESARLTVSALQAALHSPI